MRALQFLIDRRGPLFAALVAVFALGAVGNADYADALATEAEEKLARPLRAELIENSTQAAKLRECAPGAVMTVSTTRDGIPWFRRTCLYPL